MKSGDGVSSANGTKVNFSREWHIFRIKNEILTKILTIGLHGLNLKLK